MADQVEHPGVRGVGALDLLDFEFLGPRDDRTPEELIEENDDGDHGGHAPKDGARVSGAGCGLEIRSEAGQAEVARAEHEHLAGHEEEPAAGDRHHGVPDQTDGGERKLHLDETLPPTEVVDSRGLAHLFWNAFERSVEAEGHVPDLAGEDEEDRSGFDSELTAGK